jgi:hypothetical protein
MINNLLVSYEEIIYLRSTLIGINKLEQNGIDDFRPLVMGNMPGFRNNLDLHFWQ